MVKWGEVELPGFDAPLVAVTAERRDALALHLRETIADAKRSGSRPEHPAPLPPDEARKVATGCALCRGFCCRTGGNEAYLNPRTIKHVRRAQPQLTNDEIVATYLDAVPDRAFQGSCIFHAADGCSLPTSLRSNVCLTYQCTPLRIAVSKLA